MKRFLLVFILQVICVFTCLYAQCPQNTPLSSTIQKFDWTTEHFDMYIKTNPSVDPDFPVSIRSPFFDDGVNYVLQPNVAYLADDEIPDYQVEDGWELLWVNFGELNKPEANPSYALYNRYNGLIRVFFYLTAEGISRYESSLVRARHSPVGVVYKSSALFEHVNTPMNALDNFEKNISLEKHNSNVESVGSWIVGEFTAAYDPCACHHTTAIEFDPRPVKVTKVNLNIDGTNESFEIYNSSAFWDNNPNDFTAAIGDANEITLGLASLTKKGQMTFKGLKQFSNHVLNTYDAVCDGYCVSRVPDFLGDVKGIGTAVEVFDVLIGSGKSSPASKTLSGFSRNHQFEAQGDLTFYNSFQSVSIFTPGSDHPRTVVRSPVYNNALGIMNVLETPVVYEVSEVMEYWDDYGHIQTTDVLISDYQYSWQFKGTLNYAVNEVAGISGTPTELKAALYFKGCAMDGLISVSEDLYRTPFMPLSCLGDYTLSNSGTFIDPPNGSGAWDGARACQPSDIYLKIKATLQADNGEDIFYMASYKVKKEKAPYTYKSRPKNPFAEIPEVLEVDYEDFKKGGDFVAFHVIVNNFPSEVMIDEDRWNIFANDIQFYGRDGKLIDDITTMYSALNIDGSVMGCENTILAPVSAEYLQAFCESKYNPRVNSFDHLESEFQEDLVNSELDFKVYPNPASDYITVYYDDNYAGLSLEFISSQGKKCKIERAIESGSRIDVSDLSSGVYQVKVYDNLESGILNSIIKLVKI